LLHQEIRRRLGLVDEGAVEKKPTKNPPWSRDELILALELYFRVEPTHTSEKNPEIVELSRILNSLPIHIGTDKNPNFRNPNGVYMKRLLTRICA